jgi:L-iditol 2-dehydrogenase
MREAEGRILRLPESVSFDRGTFVEPLGSVLRGQHWALTSDGRSVLIIGAGITGLLHIQVARLNGAGFIAVSDINPDRLELASGEKTEALPEAENKAGD